MTSLRRLFRFIACTSCKTRSPTDGAGSIFESNGKGIKSAWDKQRPWRNGDALSHQLPLYVHVQGKYSVLHMHVLERRSLETIYA